MSSLVRKVIPKEILGPLEKIIPKEINALDIADKVIPKEIDPFRPIDLPELPGEIPEPQVASSEEGLLAGDEAARRQIAAEKKKKNRRSTILTGGLGVTDEAKTKRPTILGTV